MLNFLAGTNTMLADIPTYSVLDFSSQILQLKERRTRVGNLQRVCHLGSFRQGKFIDELESGPIDSSGLF